jgi:HJR/Mrr/RecB family endonuclease
VIGRQPGRLELIEVVVAGLLAVGAWQTPGLRPWVIRIGIAATVALTVVVAIKLRNRPLRRLAGVPLHELDPYDFEALVADYLRAERDWDVRADGGAGDLGADVSGHTADGRRVVVQCKRYAADRAVTGPQMQTFIGMARLQHHADVVVLATTGRLTAQAAELAREHDVEILTGKTLRRTRAVT